MFFIFYPYIISSVYIVDMDGNTTIMDVWGWQLVMIDLGTLTFDLNGTPFLDSWEQDNDDCQS